MAALDTAPVGGRRFYDEWLDRHLQSNSGLTNIYNIPESPTPPDEDGPFEYVDEEPYEMDAQDTVEMEDEQALGEEGLVNGTPRSMSAGPALNQGMDSTPRDVGEVYTL